MALVSSTRQVNLIVAGLDPSGGAGLIIDTRVHQHFGVFPVGVITANTVQTTCRSLSLTYTDEGFLKDQLLNLKEDFDIGTLKVGMLGKIRFLEILLELFPEKRIVLDPVITSKGGLKLLDQPEVLNDFAENLYLITPNIEEAQLLTQSNTTYPLRLLELLRKKGYRNILLKGGHLEGKYSTDYLLTQEGKLITLKGRRINKSPRGTGCALSSAIAASLTLGNGLVESVNRAKNFVQRAIENAIKAGKCHEILKF